MASSRDFRLDISPKSTVVPGEIREDDRGPSSLTSGAVQFAVGMVGWTGSMRNGGVMSGSAICSGMGGTGGGAGGVMGATGRAGAMASVTTTVASGATACSGDEIWMMPEHCLHLIFFPRRACDTLVCHWQEGHETEILAPLEASGTWPSTIGAAAFLGILADGGVPGDVMDRGGGVNWAVVLAGTAGGGTTGALGAEVAGKGAAGAMGVGGAGGAGIPAAGAGLAATGATFPTGMDLPHFGHFTSAGILDGIALIFSFALQLPHSMGINSIPHSLQQFQTSASAISENSNVIRNKQSHFKMCDSSGYR